MKLISPRNMAVFIISVPPNKSFSYRTSLSSHNFAFPSCMHTFRLIPIKSYTLNANKRKPERVLKPNIIEEVSMDSEDEEDHLFLMTLKMALMDGHNDYLEDEYVEMKQNSMLEMGVGELELPLLGHGGNWVLG
ncbi:hypothetical protein GH714_000405 [Hevea brasiliensis]|uniref:Uncharacterized protein n=1 Tax=Hevea brasiliensis TaxID=3981 RepID=A0A6A6L5C5_HEVBR|nr:hypothetical protein GH714_000405 [Hevea brasiliensis]